MMLGITGLGWTILGMGALFVIWFICSTFRQFITKPDEKAATIERVANGEMWDEQ